MRRASAYRVFLTRNSEYHVRGHVCIAVRDRRSGHWMKDHPAVSCALAQSVAGPSGRLHAILVPSLGEPLEFNLPAGPLRTSPILDIEEREAIAPGEGVSRPSAPAPIARRPVDGPRITR